jgi:hypothetical protein
MNRFTWVLAAACLAGLGVTASANIIAYTSFEEPPVFTTSYTDTLDPSTDHFLLNNAGEPVVNHVGVSELGFTSYYTNTRDDVGLTDGDFVGAIDWTGVVGTWTEGVQGFEISDADGLMTTTLDTVALPGGSASVAIDVFLDQTSWEPEDRLRVWVVVDGGTMIDLINTQGQDIDDLLIEDYWMNLQADLTGYSQATLKFEVDSNSSTERVFFDNVVFTPEPTTLALLMAGGLTILRRRS